MHDGFEWHFDQDELRNFFRSKHPHWLEGHVAGTLRIWRDQTPENYVAYAPRECLERDAILLASSFGVAWYTDRHTLGRMFHHEVAQSLTRFPEEWLKSNASGLPHIFIRLRSLLGIQFKAKELARMLRRMAPAGREPLRTYIASKI